MSLCSLTATLSIYIDINPSCESAYPDLGRTSDSVMSPYQRHYQTRLIRIAMDVLHHRRLFAAALSISPTSALLLPNG